MKLSVLLSISSCAICSAMILGSCKSKEEKSAHVEPVKKVQRTAPIHQSETISEYQRKRMRASIESAGKADAKDKARLEFEGLLRENPADLKFLRELVLEVSSAPEESQEALANALVRLYAAGEIPELAKTLDALLKTGGYQGLMIAGFTHCAMITRSWCQAPTKSSFTLPFPMSRSHRIAII